MKTPCCTHSVQCLTDSDNDLGQKTLKFKIKPLLDRSVIAYRLLSITVSTCYIFAGFKSAVLGSSLCIIIDFLMSQSPFLTLTSKI